MQVNADFSGDWMKEFDGLVGPMLEDGVAVLIYGTTFLPEGNEIDVCTCCLLLLLLYTHDSTSIYPTNSVACAFIDQRVSFSLK